MARSNYIRRIPARFHLRWGIWGISVYKRRVAKGGGVRVEEELAFEVDVNDTSMGGLMDGRYFD